jgi:hypothetical protein
MSNVLDVCGHNMLDFTARTIRVHNTHNTGGTGSALLYNVLELY